MKYICLGYYDEQQWETMSERERNALIDECFAYDDVLRTNDHFVGGEAIQSAWNATTLRWTNGKVLITDGPYAKTKELLGGILILEARDLNHAIQLMSKHPGVKAGPFEIRPAEDLTAMIHDSERRVQPHKTNKHETQEDGHVARAQERRDLRSRWSDRRRGGPCLRPRGARLFLAGRTLATLDAVARDISAAGGAADTAQVDSLDEPSVEQYIADVAKKAGGIDVSFNAIGMEDVQGTPLIEMSLKISLTPSPLPPVPSS